MAFDELRREYRLLCKLQETAHPYDDQLDFQSSLTRQLKITLNICRGMNWLKFSLEWSSPPTVPPVGSRLTSPPRIAVHRWTLIEAGGRANAWPERKLRRAIALYMLKVGFTPLIMKLRVPVALASGVVGVAKLVSKWRNVQSMAEAS